MYLLEILLSAAITFWFILLCNCFDEKRQKNVRFALIICTTLLTGFHVGRVGNDIKKVCFPNLTQEK